MTRTGRRFYISVDIAPSLLNKSILENEIGALSNVIGDAPTEVKWTTPENGGLTAVIVTWGRIKLEPLLGYVENDALANGRDPHVGMLVDFAGDLQASAKAHRDVFIIAGGAGYVYAAGFDANGRGHRHYVAIDPSRMAIRKYEASLAAILQKDRSLAPDDDRFWPDVAEETRNLALATSPAMANHILDQVFEQQRSTKLHSHVWSTLPLGAIRRLGKEKFSRLDLYGPKTEYPQVRGDIETVISNEPSDPYIAFAYFVHGDIDKAMTANHAALISNVLHYAVGYRILQSLLQDSLQVTNADPISQQQTGAAARLKTLLQLPPDTSGYVDLVLQFFNDYPAFHELKTVTV